MPVPFKTIGAPLAGVAVIAQEPTAGNPDKGTLPVLTRQVGCVVKPRNGVLGPGGKAFTEVTAVEADWQPVSKLITEKL